MKQKNNKNRPQKATRTSHKKTQPLKDQTSLANQKNKGKIEKLGEPIKAPYL